MDHVLLRVHCEMKLLLLLLLHKKKLLLLLLLLKILHLVGHAWHSLRHELLLLHHVVRVNHAWHWHLWLAHKLLIIHKRRLLLHRRDRLLLKSSRHADVRRCSHHIHHWVHYLLL
jgi:hypothetical protein